MMSFFKCCFPLLLSFGRVFSKEIIAVPGKTVTLFDVGNNTQEIALYIREEKNDIPIVIWTIRNMTFITHPINGNYTKIFMSADGKIMISEFDRNYQGNYSINIVYFSGLVQVELVELLMKDSGNPLQSGAGEEKNTAFYVIGVLAVILFILIVIIGVYIKNKAFRSWIAARIPV